MSRTHVSITTLAALGAIVVFTLAGCGVGTEPTMAVTQESQAASAAPTTEPVCPHHGRVEGQAGCPGDGHCGCAEFVDEDGDGVCDLKASGQCARGAGCGRHAGVDGGRGCRHHGAGGAGHGGTCGRHGAN